MSSETELPFGIYIHWPYCAKICPYCDFNVYKSKAQSGDDLTAAIIADLAYWRERSGPRSLTSVHFGGGTPSLMRADQIDKIITAIDGLWGLCAATQIALEANPDDADKARWSDYARAGVSRLSLGIQSFDERALGRLGRNHNGADARAALDLAMECFAQVSADLIFGHAGQSLKAWQSDLDIALQSGAGHLSCYQLTIEPGTAFGKAQARGSVLSVDSDISADLYGATRDILCAAGFDHYEVSNFAKLESTIDNRSAHNMIYWLGGDYIGAGPGAHGRLSAQGARIASIAHMTPQRYIESVREKSHGIEDLETLQPEDHGAEYVMMGLRISEGISIPRYEKISGASLNMAELSNLISQGLIYSPAPQRLAVTHSGRSLLDTVTRLLLSG